MPSATNPKAPCRSKQNLPPGYRVLHVSIPGDVFKRAKATALLRNIEWRQYLVQLLDETSLSEKDLQVGPGVQD